MVTNRFFQPSISNLPPPTKWRWWAKESISLSGVALYGIKQEKSRIAGAVDSVWLQAIEIIPISGKVAESIRTAQETEQDE